MTTARVHRWIWLDVLESFYYSGSRSLEEWQMYEVRLWGCAYDGPEDSLGNIIANARKAGTGDRLCSCGNVLPSDRDNRRCRWTVCPTWQSEHAERSRLKGFRKRQAKAAKLGEAGTYCI